MSDRRTGPVTYGQLSVLRSLETHGPDQQSVANLISAWEVPFGVGAAQVMDAWLQLVEAHESLRTTYSRSGPSPTQTVHPFRPSKVEVVELAEDSFAAALRLAAESAAEPIDIEAELPWRAFVTTHQGDALHLVTVIHHVAADNGALRVLEEQFGRLLDGGTLGPVVQPLDMAQAQQEEPAARSVRHWVEAWTQLVPADRDPGDTSERRRASLYSLEALTAAQDLSERLKISVQSVVLGVGALALARLKQTEQVTFALMAANRLTARWVPLVSSLNQFAPVTITIDEEANPLEYLRAGYLQCMTAYVNGCYDVDALKTDLQEVGRQEEDTTAFAKHFNFLGDVDNEPDAGSALHTGIQWRPSTQRSGPNFHLAVATGKGILIGVGASCDYLEGNLPAALAASIEAGLVNMSKGSEGSLGEVSLDSLPSRAV
ncbi:condensation domain-containing protein [Streptomyces sp. NBC_00988]|uniref:condensation domain-containing protein n=1 Tax=Streptomyces sp. NBC_00988 TaxID=2903704 RepID=UPI0038701B10|nr:condensation domain-containing protein [Streptomyces sp. NBC_00988]